MVDQSTRATLRERIVGQRYYDTAADETFTVVGLTGDGLLLLIQYDNGESYDELVAGSLLPKETAEQLGLSADGIENTQYIQRGPGPRLDQACDDGNHDWFPTPAEIGWDDVETWETRVKNRYLSDRYLQFVRCTRCGLSGEVLSIFEGHETPTVCQRCSNEIIPGEDKRVFHATPEWPDTILCGECAADEQERYEPTEVDCYQCGTALGERHENQPIPGSSILGQRVGADPDETIYLCGDCSEKEL